MITIKSPETIEGMHRAGKMLARLHRELREFIKPGISTLEVDRFCEQWMLDHGATPEQKGYMGFPFATCASVNDEICHGFPTHRKLKDGDLLTIDMVLNLDGYLADSAWSYLVGDVSEETKKLYDVTKEALYRGIEAAKVGARIGDIGHAIQTYVEAEGFCRARHRRSHARRSASAAFRQSGERTETPREHGLYHRADDQRRHVRTHDRRQRLDRPHARRQIQLSI